MESGSLSAADAAATFTAGRWLAVKDVNTLSMPAETTWAPLTVIHQLNVVGHFYFLVPHPVRNVRWIILLIAPLRLMGRERAPASCA